MKQSFSDFRFDYSDNRPAWLAAIDARTKLIFAAIMIIAISATLNVASYIAISATLLSLTLIIRPQSKGVGAFGLSLLIMVAITMTLHLLFNRSGDATTINLLSLPLRRSALIAGGYYSWRIGLFMLAAFLLTRSVSADELAHGFWRFVLPLRKIGVPANDIGLAILIALRFIPAIFRLQQHIKMVQTARGASFDGGLIRRTRKMIPLLVPVTAGALRKSEVLADALIVRGWGSRERRTYYGHTAFRFLDYLLLILIPAWLALIIGLAL